jgi:hypothetical protein
VLISGCALWDEETGSLGGSRNPFTRTAGRLPPIAAPADAIQIEILFVERPISDPLLGHALWQEVDQIGAIEPHVRQTLHDNGFRVGIASSSPPRALQSMLGLNSDVPNTSSGIQSPQLSARRVMLRSGAETEIQTCLQYPLCALELRGIDGSVQSKEFESVRCLFRVKARRLQDGWARLEFLPEIHHGDERLRHTAAADGWQLKTTQEVEPLFSERFELTINVGEMALVTTNGKSPRSAGYRFFVGPGEDEKVQRLLVVRLANMNHEQP